METPGKGSVSVVTQGKGGVLARKAMGHMDRNLGKPRQVVAQGKGDVLATKAVETQRKAASEPRQGVATQGKAPS